MMEYLQPFVEWFNEYYQLVVGFFVVAGGIISTVLVVWFKVKPVLDGIKASFKKAEDKVNTLSPLEMITASTQASTLREKLANPTIPDSIKLEYQQQLFGLEKLIADAKTMTDTVDTVTGKF